MSAQRVMLIEDDTLWAGIVMRFLEHNGFAVTLESDGSMASRRILDETPDVVLIDGKLPGKDGLDICREARAFFAGPIIMITARSESVDEVVGLEIGADDYICKPADPRVVLARIRAQLRSRAAKGLAQPGGPPPLNAGNIVIDQQTRTVMLADEEIALTTAEFDLLLLLASNAGRVLSRDDILLSMRGFGHNGIDRGIDMRIARLRKRLGDDPQRPRVIKTVRGQGYVFAAPPRAGR